MFNNANIIRSSEGNLGAIGGFFRFKDLPEVYGISNNHVLANYNNCQVGDSILDAHTLDQVGTLSHWVKLEREETGINQMDIALFKIDDPTTLAWRIDDPTLTQPRGFIDPKLNGHVYMILDNQVQRGYITNPYISSTEKFAMGGHTYAFTHITEIRSLDGSPFSTPGDSGSLVFSDHSHCIVALIIGTNAQRTKTYAAPFVNGILEKIPLTIF